jgi:hypothetical protein
MAYTGASTPNVGTDTTNTLSRDVHVGVLEAFLRKTRFIDKLDTRSIDGGTGAQFIIEGKEDAADAPTASYTAGTQVSISAGTQDEIVINLDRPQYVARRIDRFDEAVANYDVISMQYRQIGSKLANVVDRKAAAAIEAASLATGLVGNGDGTVVVNTALPGGVAAGTTAEALGDAITESIYAAVAAIQESDDDNEVYVALSPTNFSYLPQASKAVNTDFTSGNGGFDTGEVKMVGGAMVFGSTNVPATAGLIALAWTEQAAGVVKLWDIVAKGKRQEDFLDAMLITAYFSNGMAPLRANSAVSIKNV